MAEEKYVPRLKTKYNNEVKQQLQDKFQYENVMMIPKFEKIVVNMGVGAAAADHKLLDAAMGDLRIITGQQPCVTRAKKSIAGFHLREGQLVIRLFAPVGLTVHGVEVETVLGRFLTPVRALGNTDSFHVS